MNDKIKACAAKSDRSILAERPDLAERFADLDAQDASDNLFPGRLKSLRQELSIRQSEMAKILGVPLTTYANWEQGRTEPGIEMLRKLGVLLDVNLDDLINSK